jgi:Response regulators consisting of a CheY-like receiver domain and a winged-helix DNA-binding domain
MIAEDDAVVREFLATGLIQAGHEVVEVSDGGDVLARLSGPAPSMILLDLHMPIMDGLEIMRRLRKAEAWPNVPILFLTASSAVENMVEARRLGARGYLVKPIRLSTLIERVNSVLNDPSLVWLDDVTESHARKPA